MKWAYDAVKYFKEEKYTGIVEYDDLQERKYFKTKVGTDSQGRGVYDEIQGWAINIGKEKVLLPETINGKDISEVLPLKVLKTEQFIYQTSIYQVPVKEGGLVSFKIPAKKVYSFREWIDTYYDVEHSAKDQFTLYKLIILGSYLLKFNWRVTTGAGFGKNGVIEVFSTLLRDSNVFCPKSDSKLMTMLDDRRLLVIDEWMDLELPQKEKLEYVFRGASDGRPDMINSSLKSTMYKTKDNYNLSKLSMGFIYNELSYYQPPNIFKDKRGEYFDNLYTKATKERFIPFYFTGRIDATQFTIENPEQVYKNNKDSLRDWVQTTIYFAENFYEELKGKENWDWADKQILGGDKYNRLNNMFSNLRLILKAYSKTEDEYNTWCDLAMDRYIAYEHHLGNTNIQKTIQTLEVIDSEYV